LSEYVYTIIEMKAVDYLSGVKAYNAIYGCLLV